MVTTQKKSQVAELNKQLSENSNFLLVKVDKTTHQSLENLRKQLRKNSSALKVIKNTLFQKAVNLTTDKPLLSDLKKKFFPMREPSALVTFEKDWSDGLKTIFEFVQKEKTLSFKFGLLDNALYATDDLEKIARLPGRGELMAKIISSMKSPMNKFVYSLKYNTNKLVYILKNRN